MDAIFQIFDKDGNGSIEEDEFREGLLATIRSRFAEVISPFIRDKRLLYETGHLTSVQDPDMDAESLRVLLEDQSRQYRALCTVVEQAADDASAASLQISAFLDGQI